MFLYGTPSATKINLEIDQKIYLEIDQEIDLEIDFLIKEQLESRQSSCKFCLSDFCRTWRSIFLTHIKFLTLYRQCSLSLAQIIS